MTATLVVHLPAHRATALKLQPQAPDAAAAYDQNIGGYLQFLKLEAQGAGHAVTADQRDVWPAFSIDESTHADKLAVHAWLETQPDIWNWMPSASI